MRMIRFIKTSSSSPVTVASQMGAMNGWSWDSLAKTASDAAETTRLVTLRSACARKRDDDDDSLIR